MPPQQGAGTGLHCRHVERLEDLPMGEAPQRRRRSAVEDEIAVPFASREPARIKILGDLSGLDRRDVLG